MHCASASTRSWTAVLVSSAPDPWNVFETNLTPDEAQQYLNSPPFFEPQLSDRTEVRPLVRWDNPSYRSAQAGPTRGHYWKNGRELRNTDDYVEEVYDAAQYHGQDGLGAYAYGYRTPESSKVEKRSRSGDVQGAYTWKDGNNELIKVRYWADSEGFHQEDNLPKPQPTQETEAVKRARLAHERAWQKAAAASAQQPDPQGDYYASSFAQYQGAGSAPQNAYAAAPYSNQRYLYSTNQDRQYQGQQAQQGSYQGQQGTYQSQEQQRAREDPARGFFYSYTYPVSITETKSAQGQNDPIYPGRPIDHDTVGINAQGSAYTQWG